MDVAQQDHQVYQADHSLKGKLRRRIVRLQARRPARARFDRPLVSFSFDDAPLSAVTRAAAELERRSVRGTYFIASGLAGADAPPGRMASREDVLRLGKAGHEIGCHTFSHLNCGKANVWSVASDLDRNAETLTGWGLPTPTTFAYPSGDVSLGSKRMVTPCFVLARAVHPGLIAPGADLAQAPAVCFDGKQARRWRRSGLPKRCGCGLGCCSSDMQSRSSRASSASLSPPSVA